MAEHTACGSVTISPVSADDVLTVDHQINTTKPPLSTSRPIAVSGDVAGFRRPRGVRAPAYGSVGSGVARVEKSGDAATSTLQVGAVGVVRRSCRLRPGMTDRERDRVGVGPDCGGAPKSPATARRVRAWGVR